MKVRLKENISIKDIAKNCWNGCQMDTLCFLSNYEAEEEQKIFDAEKEDGYYLIDGYLVNENAIEEVKESEEKGNMKFKIGDRIVANKKADDKYGITKEGWKGIVTKVGEYNFEAKSTYESHEYTLSYDCFDLMLSKLEDLQFGDIVTERNGERYVFADGRLYGEDSDYYNDCDAVDDYFNDDLTYEEDDFSEHDIVKVERNGITIFERGETKEMTISEISKALGYEVKVVKE